MSETMISVDERIRRLDDFVFDLDSKKFDFPPPAYGQVIEKIDLFSAVRDNYKRLAEENQELKDAAEDEQMDLDAANESLKEIKDFVSEELKKIIKYKIPKPVKEMLEDLLERVDEHE